jgi:hypothetical protein
VLKASRANSIRLGILKECNIQEMQALDIALCEIQLLAISRWFKPSPAKRQMGPSTPILTQ